MKKGPVDLEEALEILGDNLLVFAGMTEASSVTFYPGEFPEVPPGMQAEPFKVPLMEGRYLVPVRSAEEERRILMKELETLTEVVDAQLDTIDPAGASFQVKSRAWFRRRIGKKKADDIKPEQTILCAERILKRLSILKALRDLERGQ
jgi:hypothetical protein